MSQNQSLQAVRVERCRDDVALLTLDQPGSSANVFTEDLLVELERVIEQLESDTPESGVVIVSAKPKIFIAGADLVAISKTLEWSDQRVIEFCRRGQQLFERLTRLECVVVSAIHGFCVGGGLEFALWCDRRVVSDDRRTMLGLPEVKLGLIPGWAGTVRLPRRIGLKPAIEMITGGDPISAAQAIELGLADRMVPQDDLLPAALEMIDALKGSEEIAESRRRLQQPVAAAGDTAFLQQEIQSTIDAHPTIHPSAPTIVLEHMIQSASLSADDAYLSEARAMTRVYGSEPNAGLLNTFFLNEFAKKSLPRKNDSTPKVETVAIIGMGQMGQAIAEACRGVQLLVHDVNTAQVQKWYSELPEKIQSAVTVLDDISGLLAADLVLESISEDPAAKLELLNAVQPHLKPSAILASNTSVIEIDKLAKAVERSHQFCGMHFCYPVDRRALVEIVRGSETDDATLKAVQSFTTGIRKIPVVVNDSPGFVVNRLLGTMLNEAFELLAQGNDVEQIDQSMRAFGWPMGPFEAIDQIGMQTVFNAGHQLISALPQAVRPSPLLPALLKSGRQGIQNGRGFYDHSTTPPRYDREVDSLVEKYADAKRTPVPRDRIADRLIWPMVNEAAHLLQAEVVTDPRQIDLCAIHGLGFPDFRGGPLFYADRIGLSQGIANLRQPKLPGKDARKIGTLLESLASSGGRFYDAKP